MYNTVSKNNRMYLQIYSNRPSVNGKCMTKQQQNFQANEMVVYWYSLFHKVGLWYVKATNYKPEQ